MHAAFWVWHEPYLHVYVCVSLRVSVCALPGDGSRGPSANNLVTRLGAVPATRQHYDYDADDHYNYKHRHYHYHYCHYNWRRVVATLFGQEITTNSVASSHSGFGSGEKS